MLTVEQYADSDVNERRIAEYEVKLGKNAALSDISQLLKDNPPSGGDRYNIPYFDGGTFGAIAYLDANGKVAYYTANSSSDIQINSNASSGIWVLKRLGDYAVTNENVLGYSIGSQTTTLPSYFMYRCNFFQTLYGISNVTSIGGYFLSQCYNFNQTLDISNVTSIGGYFLSQCYNFNQTLDISNVTSIGSDFLLSCYNFNQILDISNITSINDRFLSACYSFNQPLTIPSTVTSIGNNFLINNYSFNQPLTIPSTVTSIGLNILNNTHNFIGPLTTETSSSPTDNNSLSCTNNNLPMYTHGITLTGSGAQAWKDALPDRTSSPYRKLIVV